MSLLGLGIGALLLALAASMGVSRTTAAYQDVTHARSSTIFVAADAVFTPGLSKNSRMVDTALALSNAGDVYVWGRTDMAMNGGAANPGVQREPQRVPLPNGAIRQVTGGIYNANAVDNDGCVWGWGYYPERDGTDAAKPNGNPERIRVGSAWNGAGALLDKIVTISSTEYAGAGIRADGTVWHWGAPTGYGGTSTSGASRLNGLPDPSVAGNKPVYLKGAYTNFFVILENGDVYYWGGALSNSLPSGLTNTAATPKLIASLSPWAKKNVAAGAPHIVTVDGGIAMGAAMLSNGTVLSWGSTGYRVGGRTGAPTTPALVPGLNGITSMQFGFTGVALAKSDASLWGYGADDDYGRFPVTPAQIDTNVVQYASGQGYYIWQRANGAFWGRGYNPQGAIGLPSGVTITANRQVSFDLSIVAR